VKVLVTGATGFIGQHLVDRLVADGYGVRSVSRALNVDCTDANSVMRYCNGKYDYIMHLAANIPKGLGLSGNETIIDNAAMAYNIMELAAKNRAGVVYASTTAVYGTPGELPVKEDALLNCESFYALGKRLGELICLQYAYEYSLPVAVLRISAPYGMGMSSKAVIAKFVRHALAGNDLVLFGTGERSQDFTYVKDIVNAFVLAMENKAKGIYNIGTGVTTAMRKLAELVAELIGRNLNIISSPGIEDLQEHYRMAVSIDAAKKAFGYEPQYDLRCGLEEYIGQQRS